MNFKVDKMKSKNTTIQIKSLISNIFEYFQLLSKLLLLPIQTTSQLMLIFQTYHSHSMDQSVVAKQWVKDSNGQDDRLFFNLIEKAGSMGRYQIFTYVLWSAIAYLFGGIVFSFPFLFYQNDYQCGETQTKSQCYDYVCSLPINQRQAYIVSGHFESMINKFGDYRCPSELEEMNWAITASYSGVFFGMLILVIFGSYFGRKTLCLVNLLVSSAGMILSAFGPNLFWAALGIFFVNLGIMISYHITFYFITQIVSQKYRQKFSAQVQVFYGVGATLNVLWFYCIQDYQYVLICCYFIPSLIIMGFMLPYVKQTPMFLITDYNNEKILQDFKDIARYNKKTDFDLTHEDIDEIKAKYQKILSLKAKSSNKNFNFIDLFRYKSLRFMTIILTLMICSITFIFMAPSLLLSAFNLDIFVNGLVVQSSQIVAYILACLILSKLKRKTIAYICFSITFISSFLLIFIWDQNSSQISGTSQKILILILVFAIQLSISTQFACFYVYFNQIYPTQIRAIGTGMVAASSGLLYTFSQKVIEFCYAYNFKVMILITALTGVCLLCIYVLPQTFGKVPAQLILELTSSNSNQKSQSLLSTSSKPSQHEF